MGMFDQKTDNPEALRAVAQARGLRRVQEDQADEAAEMALGDSEALALDHPRKHGLLLAYAKTGNITDACRCAGVSRPCHYLWMKNDANYVEAFAVAKSIAADSFVREARRRAVEGVERPIYQSGQLVGTELVFSDRLLEVLLKGSDPETYQRKSVEVTGNVQHTHTGEVSYQVQEWHLELKGPELLAEMRRQMQNNRLGLPTEPPKEIRLIPNGESE